MLNEWTEFLQYTSPVCYTAMGKRDNSYIIPTQVLGFDLGL